MQNCKFCSAPIKEGDVFCHLCGYDPKTDTINPSFKLNRGSSQERNKKMREEEERYSRGINPVVKMFAFIGLAVVIFSILYKHNFNIDGSVFEVIQYWDKCKAGISKIIPATVENKKEPKEEARAGGSETFNPSKSLIVQGVFWGGPRPQAIINNGIINVGDVIDGAKVIEINQKGVVLLYKERTYLLPSSVSKYKND